MRNCALIIQKVFTLPRFYFWPNVLDLQLLILHVRGRNHQPRSQDRYFSWPLVRGCGKFRSPAYLILVKGKVKYVVQIWYQFLRSILNDIKYFTLLTLYSMLVMGDFKCGKCVTLLLTWVKGKARYGRTLLILVNVYNKCIAKQYFKLPRIYFWLWSKVTWNYILSHLWNADEIND